MTYTYDNITKELRTRKKSIKKTITELNTKIESIEERYALGEVDNTIYKKFKEKYETQKGELQSKIENPSLSSSNLELAIDKALTLSESLEKIWVDGDLKQRQKLQNLVFPSGLGYDKSNDQSSNPKSERYFWLNPDFIEGNLKHKKRRTNSSESILRFSDPGRIRTPNPQSRNLIFYPVELLGQCRAKIHF